MSEKELWLAKLYEMVMDCLEQTDLTPEEIREKVGEAIKDYRGQD